MDSYRVTQARTRAIDHEYPGEEVWAAARGPTTLVRITAAGPQPQCTNVLSPSDEMAKELDQNSSHHRDWECLRYPIG
jgi:hypothetical protein